MACVSSPIAYFPAPVIESREENSSTSIRHRNQRLSISRSSPRLILGEIFAFVFLQGSVIEPLKPQGRGNRRVFAN